MDLDELSKPKKENKTLKKLLRNAVDLLKQSKTLLTSAKEASPSKSKARKKAAKKT